MFNSTVFCRGKQVKVGDKFNHLTFTGNFKVFNKKEKLYETQCDCSIFSFKRITEVLNGKVKTCGYTCIYRLNRISNINKSHGKTETAEYTTWSDMRQRCLNPNNKGYKNYGGRGIKICERWLRFENFLEDMGKKTFPRASIERKNNELGYFKENCKWSNSNEQNNNKRTNVLTRIPDFLIRLEEDIKLHPQDNQYIRAAKFNISRDSIQKFMKILKSR